MRQRFPTKFSPLVIVCFILLIAVGNPARAQNGAVGTAGDFTKNIRPFLEQHCLQCHGEDEQKGDFRLDTLELNFINAGIAGRWTDVMDRMNTGEMPPKKQPRPKVAEVARVAEWIASQLTEAEAVRQVAIGEKVSFRRLSRDEYRNTIRDLLGVTYDAADPAGLPEDPDWQGFERIGSVLTLSPAHVEKYMAAAETVLNEAVALGPSPQMETTRWSATRLRMPGDVAERLATRGLIDKVRVDIVIEGHVLGIAQLGIRKHVALFVSGGLGILVLGAQVLASQFH